MDSMDWSWVWGTLHAHPLRAEKEVRDQFGGRPRVVGSKLTGAVMCVWRWRGDGV